MIKWANRLAFARNKKLLFLFTGLVIIAVTLVVSYVVHQKNNKGPSLAKNKGATAQQAEQAIDKTKDGLLLEKDYDLFQASQLSLVGQYLTEKDPLSAERVLNDIVKNVPQDKIRPEVYMQFWGIANAKGDSVAKKQYAQKIVNALKAEEKPDQAAIDNWNKQL